MDHTMQDNIHLHKINILAIDKCTLLMALKANRKFYSCLKHCETCFSSCAFNILVLLELLVRQQTMHTEDTQDMYTLHHLEVNSKDQGLLLYNSSKLSKLVQLEHHLTAIPNHRFRQFLDHQFLQRLLVYNHIYPLHLLIVTHRASLQRKDCLQFLCLKTIHRRALHQTKNITAGLIRFVTFYYA